MSGVSTSIPTQMWSTSLFAECGQKSMIHSRKSSSTQFVASVMSSNRAEPRSIATQLVLLFTLCATLLLSCSLGILYWVVVRHAFEEDNIVLADKVDALENALHHGGLDALSAEIRETHGSEYPFLV